VNLIKNLQTNRSVTSHGLLAWLAGNDPSADLLKWIIVTLAALVALMAIVRYLREVSNTQMSMNMVFPHPRRRV